MLFHVFDLAFAFPLTSPADASAWGQPLSAVSPDPARLEVEAPPQGVIIITGRAVRELAMVQYAGRATIVRMDGKEIHSVTRISEVEAAAAQAARAIRLDPADISELKRYQI